jgi:hypothetical protein
MIEANDSLAKQVKRIYWSHGAEEIQMLNGNRFMIKAGGSSARGVSRPETVYLDELREMHDLNLSLLSVIPYLPPRIRKCSDLARPVINIAKF